MSHDATKSVFGVSEKVILKPVSSVTGTSCNFACSKFGYDTFQNAKNKGADQSARMRRLVCAFTVCNPPKTGFPASRPILSEFFLIYLKMHIFLICKRPFGATQIYDLYYLSLEAKI